MCERTYVSKALAAIHPCAEVRSLACVCPHVDFDSALLRKSLPTDVALVGPLFCMNASVAGKIRSILEAFAASCPSASVGGMRWTALV